MKTKELAALKNTIAKTDRRNYFLGESSAVNRKQRRQVAKAIRKGNSFDWMTASKNMSVK